MFSRLFSLHFLWDWLMRKTVFKLLVFFISILYSWFRSGASYDGEEGLFTWMFCPHILFMRRQNTQSPPKIDCFEYIKQSLLKSNHQKYTCQIFIRKKIPESKISKPKNPLIIPAASLATPEHLHPLGACILRYQEKWPRDNIIKEKPLEI